MKHELTIGSTVYNPCTNFNSGEKSLEEMKINEIGEDFIVLTHVATLRKRGEEIHREEVAHTVQKGGKKELEYYSRPFDVIMKEHSEDLDWLTNRILEDTKK